jgi:hypothetical protein
MKQARFAIERTAFHRSLCETILSLNAAGVPSNADSGQETSIAIASGIARRLPVDSAADRLAGQTSGSQFEAACAEFIRATFLRLDHLRPGSWEVRQVAGRDRLQIAQFEQYAHLVALDRAARSDRELAAALGNDYAISPDVIVLRQPEEDKVINKREPLVDDSVATRASLREANGGRPILHASISCKWTIRSDRAQNARSEALNLVRNRKGRLPHVVVITAEPTPSRLASLALGTGDIDCVYHFALSELIAAVEELDLGDSSEMLSILVDGNRLRDISDLPLDLAT